MSLPYRISGSHQHGLRYPRRMTEKGLFLLSM